MAEEFGTSARAQRPCPADFEQTMIEIGRLGCEDEYNVGRLTVNRWLEECGKQRLIEARAAFVRAKIAAKPKRKCPVDFSVAFPRLGMKGCQRRYRADHRTINRWIDECGRDRLLTARARETGRKLNTLDLGRLLSAAYPVNLNDAAGKALR